MAGGVAWGQVKGAPACVVVERGPGCSTCPPGREAQLYHHALIALSLEKRLPAVDPEAGSRPGVA